MDFRHEPGKAIAFSNEPAEAIVDQCIHKARNVQAVFNTQLAKATLHQSMSLERLMHFSRSLPRLCWSSSDMGLERQQHMAGTNAQATRHHLFWH